MTVVKAIEYRISHKLMHRREAGRRSGRRARLPERLINGLATTVVLAVIGTYLPELLWVIVGAASVMVIGVK